MCTPLPLLMGVGRTLVRTDTHPPWSTLSTLPTMSGSKLSGSYQAPWGRLITPGMMRGVTLAVICTRPRSL